MGKDRLFFQKGEQKVFIGMFIVLILLAFLGLSFSKDIAFGSLKERALSERPSGAIAFIDDDHINIGIGGVNVSVEIARSAEKKAKGLSNRYFLEENKGMLFVFDKKDIYPFWNKDTFIPLDILWIEDDEVVYVLEGLPVYEGGDKFTERPERKANFVLELNAGFVKEYSIEIGDKIIISK